MKDRSLLVLLMVTAAFIFYVKPARENSELLQSRLVVLDSQIAAQEALKKGSAEFGRRIKATGAAAATNESYIFPASTSSSLALVALQDLVKTAATSSNMEIVTSTWGESVPDAATGMIRIPMSFMLKGVPPDLDKFFQKLLYGKQFIKIERASISRYQNQQLMLNLALVAFKRGTTP